MGPDRRKIDISKARNEFGYKVTTKLEDGIQKTIEWYLSNNWNSNFDYKAVLVIWYISLIIAVAK